MEVCTVYFLIPFPALERATVALPPDRKGIRDTRLSGKGQLRNFLPPLLLPTSVGSPLKKRFDFRSRSSRAYRLPMKQQISPILFGTKANRHSEWTRLNLRSPLLVSWVKSYLMHTLSIFPEANWGNLWMACSCAKIHMTLPMEDDKGKERSHER